MLLLGNLLLFILEPTEKGHSNQLPPNAISYPSNCQFFSEEAFKQSDIMKN